MATRKKKKKQKRSEESYISSAKNLSKIVPNLKKYRKRKHLTRYEKSAITRREKQLRGVEDLIPLTKQQAKRLRKKTFAPGIRAIRLRGVKGIPKLRVSKKGDISIKSGTVETIYWALDRETVRSRRRMREAGADAFDKLFPIEKVSDLAARAFKNLNVQQIHLWTNAGAVGDGFADLPAFIRWVNEKWQAGRYITIREAGNEQSSDPGLWINGIAIELENPEYTRARKALKNVA